MSECGCLIMSCSKLADVDTVSLQCRCQAQFEPKFIWGKRFVMSSSSMHLRSFRSSLIFVLFDNQILKQGLHLDVSSLYGMVGYWQWILMHYIITSHNTVKDPHVLYHSRCACFACLPQLLCGQAARRTVFRPLRSSESRREKRPASTGGTYGMTRGARGDRVIQILGSSMCRSAN